MVHGRGTWSWTRHTTTQHLSALTPGDTTCLRFSSACRAGSSVAVPQLGERAACARGTDCPVYFQGVVILPGCDRSRGILLHNN